MMQKPRLAVHKFTSCDGCQLAFLNAGEALLQLSELVDIVHFAEAGRIDLETPVQIAFIEGSISTPDEIERIKIIRSHSKFLITIGACATAGGIQALRNASHYKEWISSIYASPQTIQALATSTPISNHVLVDLELWGCPVNTNQVMSALRSLLLGAVPRVKRDSVCLECKRKGQVCVLVAKKEPCMGPVTQTGCGAICPERGRGCYACYGPSENPNPLSLGNWFMKTGSKPEKIAQQFLHINNLSAPFHQAGLYFKGIKIVQEKK